MKSLKNSLGFALFAAACMPAAQITAFTPTPVDLVATGGQVFVYFADVSSDFDSTLSLVSPVSVGPFFPNHGTVLGSFVNLGTFSAGQTLRFRLDVTQEGGHSYFTGPASGNPDNVVHAATAYWETDGAIPFSGVILGFEDLFGGGDLDFNDNAFVLVNVAPVLDSPEPSTWMLGISGAGLIAFLRKRRYSQIRRVPCNL